MATDKQIAYYNSLCAKLGQEPEDDFENLNNTEASRAISEIKELLKESDAE